MFVDISNNVLDSIKKELLTSLGLAEAKVADLLDFGEEQAGKEVLSLLHLSKAVLLALAEKEAAAACESIKNSIKLLLENDSDVEINGLAPSFLVLTQYIGDLSTTKQSNATDLQKVSAMLSVNESGYVLDAKAEKVITDAIAVIKETQLGDYPEPYWKKLYKITDVVKGQFQTKESYHYLWLHQQLALFCVKKKLTLPHVEAKKYAEKLCDYLSRVIESGERLEVYRNIHDDVDAVQSALDDVGEVQKNDYQPPNASLATDGNETEIVFPISEETIESIAFAIKKELVATKSLFEEGLESNSIEEQSVQQALFDSLSLTEAAFKLLGFRPGVSLVEQAEDLLTNSGFEGRYEQFADNIVLIEDALWQLDFLQNEEFMGAQEAALQQQQHSRHIAVQATKLAIGKRAYTFFKKSRDFLIENFDELNDFDTLEATDSLHQLVASYQLLSEQELLPSLKKAELLHLYLDNDKAKLSKKGVNNAYLDLLIAYEILFEQLQVSIQVDKRTLALLDKSFDKVAEIVNFSDNYQFRYSYDYGVGGRPQDPVQAATDDLLNEVASVDSAISAQQKELDSLSSLSSDSSKDGESVNEQTKGDHIAISAQQGGMGGGSDPGGDSAEKGESVDEDSKDNHIADNSVSSENDIFNDITADKSFLAEHQVAPFNFDDVDEEILEIFIEEGRDISSLLLLETPALKDNYFNEEVISNLRRAYHTLKGSGRMVGLNAVGEFAWQHEELFNDAIAGQYQLNDVAFKQLTHAAQLVDKTVNCEPFEEPTAALMACAAKAYTIRQILSGKKEFPSPETVAPVSTNDTSNSPVDLSSVNEAAPVSLPDSEVQGARNESAMPLSSTAQVIPDLAAHPALSMDVASDATAEGTSVNEVFDTKDVSNAEITTSANESLSALKDFVQSAAPTVNASQDNFVEWESEQYQLDNAFQSLKTNVDSLNSASKLVDYEDNSKVTQSLSEVLSTIADSNYPVTPAEADPIKFAIDDLARMHQEILDDKEGYVGSGVLENLTAVNQSVEFIPATNSIDDANSSNQPNSSVPQSIETVGDINDENHDVKLDESQNIEDKALTADSAVLGEEDISDDSILSSTNSIDDANSPNQSNSSMPQSIDSVGDIDDENHDVMLDESQNTEDKALTADSAVFGEEGINDASVLPPLSVQTNKIRQKFSSEHLVGNGFQHNEIIDDIYDLEASLDTQNAPSWVWETLANLENSVNGMEQQGLSPTTEDYEKVCMALDAVEQADQIESSVAKEINNTLMGIRASLPLRASQEKRSQLSEQTVEISLNSATQSIDDGGYVPDSHSVISAEITASSSNREVSGREKKTTSKQADASLLQNISLKVEEDRESSHLHDSDETSLDDAALHIQQGLDAPAGTDSSEFVAEISAAEELGNSLESTKYTATNDKLNHSIPLDADVCLDEAELCDESLDDNKTLESDSVNADSGLSVTAGKSVTAPQGGSMQMHQQFAEEAGEQIEASKAFFDDWKNSDFEHYEPLDKLHDSISDITEISRKHQFDSATELGEGVGAVLQRLTEESVKPYSETSEKVSDAIDEFDRSAASARSGQGDPEITGGVIQMLQTVAGSTAVGEVPISTSSMYGVSAGALLGSVVPALPDEIASDQTQFSGDPINEGTGSYKQFATSATGHISASKEYFGDWRATGFTESSPRDMLSESIKEITQLSEENHFDSGAQLGRSVNEVLDKLSEERLYPNKETVQRIEEAVDEFDRSAKAITTNADEQEARPEVIRRVMQAGEFEPRTFGQSLDSSLMAHELFSESVNFDDSFGFQTAMSEQENTVIPHTPDKAVEDFSQAETITDEPETQADLSNGLRFNDPRQLDTTILDIFLDEAHDIVEKSYQSLSDWNKDHNDLSAIQEIQRGLHTLKGGARMSELTVLGDLSHYMETLLGAVVDGNIIHKSEAHDLLLEGIDLSSEMVRLADSGQVVYESPDYIEGLNQFIEGQTGKSLGYERIKPDDSAVAVTKEMPLPAKQQSYTLRVGSELMDNLANLVGEDSIARARLERTAADHGFQLDELSRTIIRVGEQLRRLENETEAQILFRHDTFEEVDEDFDPLELDRFSEIQQLSRLLAESMEDLQSLRTSLVGFIDESKQIITDQASIQRELQDKILSASLVRFDSLRPRVETLVRQVAKDLDKEVSILIYGGEIEVERKMMEEVMPGLEHVIRNAIAHGIESPKERAALGKPDAGRIQLGVRREGSELLFVVADDGKGANLESIRAKARTLGMLNEDLANDKDYLLQLLFAPGFSTAHEATQVSGRGIGLDVLKQVANDHNGRIEVETEMNKGMAISVRIPFTMSITDALSVKIGRYYYAVPIMSIEGIARIPKELYQKFMSGEQAYYSYGQYDYRLESLIGFVDPQAEKTESLYGVPALLVRVGRQRIAFEVEEINNRQEIIIKSVNHQFTTLPGVVGAAVLDNGLPVPVVEIAALGREFLSFREMGGNVRDLLDTAQEPELRLEKPRVLVVDDSVTMRKVSSKILSKYDFEVATAKDGLDAIDVVTSWVPDLILLDIEMPRMDGFEFAIHIRNSDDLKSVPIIMITSRTGEKHRERADAIGVNGYLGKPYTEEILISTIEKILGMEFDKNV